MGPRTSKLIVAKPDFSIESPARVIVGIGNQVKKSDNIVLVD